MAGVYLKFFGLKVTVLGILLQLYAPGVLSALPFSYDLHIATKKGQTGEFTVAAHGMGGDYRLIETIPLNHTLISFNFPDYQFGRRNIDLNKLSYGTIHEILPLLYVINKTLKENHLKQINLYGFSAGAGAIINALAVLQQTKYDEDLAKIGIAPSDKINILEAIQKGTVILDTPLKSIQELLDFRGNSIELILLNEQYRRHEMIPIDNLHYLKGLKLNILVHFQNPDEILSNKDDREFFEKLKAANAKGITVLSIGKDGGHNVPHPTLWRDYTQFLKLVGLKEPEVKS